MCWGYPWWFLTASKYSWNCRTTPISEHDEVGTKLAAYTSGTCQVTSRGCWNFKSAGTSVWTPGVRQNRGEKLCFTTCVDFSNFVRCLWHFWWTQWGAPVYDSNIFLRNLHFLQFTLWLIMEIMKKKVLIVRILMALLHFFKRPPLSNGLQSDLETRAVHSLLVVDYGHTLIVARYLEPSVDTRERVRRIVAMFELNLFQ